MYIFSLAIVKYKNSPKQWERAFNSNFTLREICRHYSDVYFLLSNTVLPGLFQCRLKDILELPLDMSKTLAQNFNLLDNLHIPNVLPFTGGSGPFIVKSATYADALQAGWRFKTKRFGVSPDDDNIGAFKDDLFLEKDGIDIVKAGKSLLCLVNGMAHYTYTGYNGIIATGGGRVMRATESNLVSFINLGHIGDIEYGIIDSSMLSPGTKPGMAASFDGYLNLNMDLTGKSLIVSLGGILYFEGNVIKVINRAEGIIKLNYHRVDHGSFFHELNRYIKPETLGSVTDNIEAGILTKSAIYDIDNLKAILDLDQTFAIVVDSEEVSLENKAVQDGTLKNVLTSYELPNKPIRGFSGRFLPYKFKSERGKYSIFVDDYKTPAFLHWTTNQFAVNDYISYGIMRSEEDLSNASVFSNITSLTFS